MASVKGIEQRTRLGSANLPKNDPVGAEAESAFQERVKRHLGLEGIGLRCDRYDVRLLNLKLRRVLDYEEALFLGNRVRENAQKRGLSGASSAIAAYEDNV